MADNLLKLPKLYYSTWGEGFYSKVWVNDGNSWMYSLIKFVEKNLDIERDKKYLEIFAKLTASDYPFMYRNGEQKDYAEEKFLSYFYEIVNNIKITYNEVFAFFPVDPYWGYFSLVKYNNNNELSEESTVKFKIERIGENIDCLNEKRKFNIIETKKKELNNIQVHFQNFLLYPGLYYDVINNNNKLGTIQMPERGIPFIITSELDVSFIYDSRKLHEQLELLWGNFLEIDLKTDITKQSKCIYKLEDLRKIVNSESKTAVFKYNKETYSIIRYKDLSEINPSIIFDDRIKLDDAGDFINFKNTDIKVENELTEENISSFNTLLFTCSINFESELDIIRKLVNKAVEKDIPIISLYDDITKYAHIQDILEKANGNNFYRIGVDEDEVKEYVSSDFFQYKSQKVLAVLGTDTVQGKFTTQIALREELKNKINVKHFATEPTGILLGADVSFSRVDDTDENRRIAFQKKIIWEIEKDNDLIITGGQNSIIYDPSGKGNYQNNVSTRIFNVFLPRWVILTVSVDTTLKEIKESLKYIKKLSKNNHIKTDVIGFVIMKGRKLHGERWTETFFIDVDQTIIDKKIIEIEKTTGIKVYHLPNDISNLGEDVIKSINN